jgi:hypothetical protein
MLARTHRRAPACSAPRRPTVARWKEVCARCPPPGLSLPVTFTGSGDTVGGTPADPGVEPGRNFTVQGTGDQGQPLYQAYTINVNQNEPLAINASGGTDLGPAKAGTYTFTMRLTDYPGQQATQQFTLVINS